MGRPQRALAGRPVAAPAGPVSVADEIARLDPLDLGQLRVQFRNRTGRIAPAHLSKSLLLRVLAYRMQADHHGDLRSDTRRMLDRIASASGKDAVDGGARGAQVRREATPVAIRPKRGTVLAREWQGRMEHVMVLDDGFLWSGSTYPSLSATAFAITGTKWNGRRFFGLDRHASPSQPKATR